MAAFDGTAQPRANLLRQNAPVLGFALPERPGRQEGSKTINDLA